MVDEIVIESGRSDANYWLDLWRYRDLFQILAWRDVAVRYRQTVLGVIWAVARPFITMLIFVLVFGRIAGFATGETPYALVVLAGMLPWQLFASSLADAGNSLVNNSPLLTKVYFPRLILPASCIVVALFDFVVTLALLLGVMAWYGFVPPARIVFLPVFVLMAVATALGAGLIASAMTAMYRDFRIIIPFIIQFGLYISPVGFRSQVVENALGPFARLAYAANPLVGVIDGFRWCIGVEPSLHVGSLVISGLFTAGLLVAGVRFFRSVEKSFADVV